MLLFYQGAGERVCRLSAPRSCFQSQVNTTAMSRLVEMKSIFNRLEKTEIRSPIWACIMCPSIFFTFGYIHDVKSTLNMRDYYLLLSSTVTSFIHYIYWFLRFWIVPCVEDVGSILIGLVRHFDFLPSIPFRLRRTHWSQKKTGSNYLLF